MAFVTASAVVVEVEAKVWAFLYGCVVVAVEMSLALMPQRSQLVEDDAYRWLIEAVGSCVLDDVWLPPTINTLPSIPLEALYAEPAVIRTISAPCKGWAAFINLLLTWCAARSVLGQTTATVGATTFGEIRHLSDASTITGLAGIATIDPATVALAALPQPEQPAAEHHHEHGEYAEDL
jgi:hypothetical protein